MLCRTKSPASLLDMQSRLVNSWVGLIKNLTPSKQMSRLPVADIVVMLEVFWGDGSGAVVFGTFIAGIGKWFRHSDKAAFAVHQFQDLNVYNMGQTVQGLLLAPERHEFVPPASYCVLPRPLEEGSHGVVKVLDLDELSHHVLTLASGDKQLKQVKATPLKWKPAPTATHPDAIRIIGAEASASPVVVSCASDPIVAQACAPQKGPAPPTQGDLLDGLLAFRQPPASAKAPAASSQPGDPTIGEAPLDVLADLDDASRRELELAMREADEILNKDMRELEDEQDIEE